MAKAEYLIKGSVRVGGQVFNQENGDELGAKLTKAEAERLTEKGVIAGITGTATRSAAEVKAEEAAGQTVPTVTRSQPAKRTGGQNRR
jgi:hypothetical protein